MRQVQPDRVCGFMARTARILCSHTDEKKGKLQSDFRCEAKELTMNE